MASSAGNRNGAPRSAISAARPAKDRRMSARASGIASATEKAADSAACSRVKRSADQSAGVGAASPPARHRSAASGSPMTATGTTIASPRATRMLIGGPRRAAGPGRGRAAAPPCRGAAVTG
jgi:hypothetical protein